MFAGIVPFYGVLAGSSWLISGLLIAVLLMAMAPAPARIRRLAYGVMVAAAIGFIGNILVPCQFWWFC